MRIAVSGAHWSGKSTLIEEFLRVHTEFAHEPEPYTAMVELYGEAFSAEPSVEDMFRQLEFNIDQLAPFKSGSNAIFERCPMDFFAYILALRNLKRDQVGNALLNTARRMALNALAQIDMIVFLALDDADGIDVPDDEDPALREAVNARLEEIFADEDLGRTHQLQVIEVRGSLAQRLMTLEHAISDFAASK